MIDEATKTIYFDNSTRSTFQACKEKCRLGLRDAWRATDRKASLDFGHAIHAGWAAYYDAKAGGYHDSDGNWHTFEDAEGIIPLQRAQAAFLRDLHFSDATIPVNLEAEERRSIERGLALLDAYVYRWRAEPYDNLLIEGKPQTEVGFRYNITEFEGWPVVYVGYIDRLMWNTRTGRGVMFEGKTTTQGLSQYVLQCKPNNQITGYFPAALAIDPSITECVWDCMFISSRQSDMQKALGDRFWMYGIDIGKDFARQTTSRSATDISEFLKDLEIDAIDYCQWLTRADARWPRTTGACHSYGGCQFRNRCSMNLRSAEEEQAFMESNFRIERWEPWKRIAKIQI